jgi:hypothetical protein
MLDNTVKTIYKLVAMGHSKNLTKENRREPIIKHKSKFRMNELQQQEFNRKL